MNLLSASARRRFWRYFNVADEIYEGLIRIPPMDQTISDFDSPLTLADLDAEYVAEARRAADELGLPWPPYLPEAEEFALNHREVEDLE